MVVIEKTEYSNNEFYLLKDNSWGGALDTLNDIEKADKEEEFMDYLNNYVFFCQEVENTTLNDYIWFERDEIYNYLGLDENGEIEDEE